MPSIETTFNDPKILVHTVVGVHGGNDRNVNAAAFLAMTEMVVVRVVAVVTTVADSDGD